MSNKNEEISDEDYVKMSMPEYKKYGLNPQDASSNPISFVTRSALEYNNIEDDPNIDPNVKMIDNNDYVDIGTNKINSSVKIPFPKLEEEYLLLVDKELIEISSKENLEKRIENLVFEENVSIDRIKVYKNMKIKVGVTLF